jgi:hypothetical protein
MDRVDRDTSPRSSVSGLSAFVCDIIPHFAAFGVLQLATHNGLGRPLPAKAQFAPNIRRRDRNAKLQEKPVRILDS